MMQCVNCGFSPVNSDCKNYSNLERREEEQELLE